MASSVEYLNYILEQLSALEGITYRAMMGEYILYYQDRIIGGIYDDRLLVKPAAAARHLMPEAPEELPYEGTKPMLLVEQVDDSAFLCKLCEAMLPELPAPRKRRQKA
ncbi:MAG: TfoX/Sxy family protein [Oscillospiraceae bacterium]|nr:TfoX/Sxy family protein [Oscillospiraceae bacterium]